MSITSPEPSTACVSGRSSSRSAHVAASCSVLRGAATVALAAAPNAAAFFDSRAQVYRRAYLRWIDATKRSPELRASRIAEVVRLCEDGVKERPRPPTAR